MITVECCCWERLYMHLTYPEKIGALKSQVSSYSRLGRTPVNWLLVQYSFHHHGPATPVRMAMHTLLTFSYLWPMVLIFICFESFFLDRFYPVISWTEEHLARELCFSLILKDPHKVMSACVCFPWKLRRICLLILRSSL